MTHRYLAPIACMVLTAAGAAFSGDAPVQEKTSAPSTTELRTMTARFVPADIGADLTKLADSERKALGHLVEAARIMDSLFLRQVWAGNDALLQQLSRDVVTRPAGPERTAAEARLHYFLVNKGPWSRLDHNKPFVPGARQTRSRQLLSCRSDHDQVQKWLDRPQRRREGVRHRVLHHDPKGAPGFHGGSVFDRIPGSSRTPRRTFGRPRTPRPSRPSRSS